MDCLALGPRHPRYPALLAAAPAPPDLWVRGTLVAEDTLAIAIVGTRRASAYGAAVAERLAFDLAARGITIVSGLARGIDTAAHRGALAAAGRTLAVLGSGVDVVYPPESRALMEEIVARGALVSQFPLGTAPLAWHFPARNRTLAGLALGVVVVEAPERSGALITASLAADLGREVFAVPGQITSPTSQGANALIQDGAKLIRGWQDVVQELPDQWRRAVRAPSPGHEVEVPAVDSEEGRLLALLRPDEPQHIERLIARTGSSPGRVAAALIALELNGRARQLDGQRWVTVPNSGGRT
ncbi:MAG: DNA-processing protein DprA [Candidatus Rokuibacteriota bacterium]